MKIVRGQVALSRPGPCLVSVGNFDGVHAGHQQLIKSLRTQAKQCGVRTVVVTFEPHTRAVLNPASLQAVLTTTAEKEMLFEALSPDVLVILEFSEHMANLEPGEFIDSILIERLGAVGWVMGEDQQFGRKRRGSKNFLHNDKSRKHFRTFATSLSRQRADVVSSTQIRSRILVGNMSEALQMLGHPYLIVAQRVQGTHTGRSLGYPTLNFKLPPSSKVLPPAGVYAARLSSRAAQWCGALYLGGCPTFGDRDRHLEFHALTGDGPYPAPGECAALWVEQFERSDERFADTQALSRQIGKDIKAVEDYFGKRKE